jgi:methylmalonyl-CoA/ethylmalonyl-CoA epimerase
MEHELLNLQLSVDLQISHIGIAVKNISETKEMYRILGFEGTDGPYYIDELQGVRALFIRKDSIVLELLEPLHQGQASLIDNYLKGTTHNMYHICYTCSDIDRTIQTLKKEHFRLLAEPIPGIGFQDHRICFLYHRKLGIVELVEE